MFHIWEKKKNNCKRIYTAAILAVCLIAASGTQTAYAAGEQVYFGSESYEWWLEDDNFLLGLYAASDDGVEEATLTVSYDPEMLEPLQGGTVTESGSMQVELEETQTGEFKRLISFQPLMAGETEVTIESAQVTNANGETVEAAAQSVPITIEIPDGCQLDGITVNGIEVPDFDGAKAAYQMELEENATSADIQVTPADASVEISDTALQTGTNTVDVIVTGADGSRARYALTLDNPEAAVAAEAQENTESQEETVQTDAEIAEDGGDSLLAGSLSYARDHKLLVVLAVLIILFLLLNALLMHQRKKERERKRRREERRRQWEERHAEGNGAEAVRKAPKAGTAASDDALEEDTAAADDSVEEDADAPDEFMDEDWADEPVEEDPRELEIRVSHVTMDFKREKDESTSIKELVIRTLKHQRSFEYFRALDDVSFDVHSGEVVGIIGTNGSGKSTILKIISGVLSPTSGNVEVDQHKIQLLTLGTGFDMELTGRENVYLNGALIGYTKEYIDEKYDDIVKFAELEGFMDEKVRNYSSGMVSRLGFAISTVRDTPEILILDEVLSVGDMFFRRKSEARIQEMIHGGSTILIVSHSTGVIRKNCTKAVWIEKGHLKMVGNPGVVCTAYEEKNQ